MYHLKICNVRVGDIELQFACTKEVTEAEYTKAEFAINGVDICNIAYKDKSDFIKDFKSLIDKYSK